MDGANVKRIRPQDGYQMRFAASSADIVIGGAAAGVGKTFSLLLEPIRNKDVKGFESVFFRRTSPQIKAAGGLWDTSMTLYPLAGARPRETSLEWLFESSKLKFSHLEYEKNKNDWQGSQIALICFDELTHFTRSMFFYLLTRNRSVCGVKPYVRATCNPDPDSWVAELIAWWIDQETGYPIPERDGVIRYFIQDGDNMIWGDSEQEVIDKAWYMLEELVKRSGLDPRSFVKSITFISGSIYDNKELLSVDPAYLGNLLSQDEATQLALLKGNWKAVISDQDIYDYYSLLGCFENSIDVSGGKKAITADIALEGSNKFIVGGWDGFELVDIEVLDKSDGPKVVDTIKAMARRLSVPNTNIVYDADGVGGFVHGYIPGAKPFNNNGTPLPMVINGKRIAKPNYKNLKAQCYYLSGKRVKDGGKRISEQVAMTMYDDKMTVRQRFMHERKAIKKDKVDTDLKLQLIPKEKMKVFLGGESPDIMDMFMMREYLELHTGAAALMSIKN